MRRRCGSPPPARRACPTGEPRVGRGRRDAHAPRTPLCAESLALRAARSLCAPQIGRKWEAGYGGACP
eukprot:2905823-Prymnesium_polylepis.1